MFRQLHRLDHVNKTILQENVPAISVVLPVYNEESNLPAVIPAIVDKLREQPLSFEIIAVNDGSSDGSLDSLKTIQAHYPGLIRIANHLENKGNGAALRSGIILAKGDIVVLMDADGQHHANDILELLKCVPPYDMVVGARTNTYRGAWYRNFANRFYNYFASWLTQKKIADLTSGFRAFRREIALHFIHLLPNGFSSPTTLTMTFLKAGYTVKFLPIDVQPRQKGHSKIRLWKDGKRFFTIIIRMIMLYNPMRIFIPIIYILSILGIITMIAGILAAGRLVVPGSSVVLFMAASLSLLLGTISSQIADTNIHYYGDEYIMVFEDQTQSGEDIRNVSNG